MMDLIDRFHTPPGGWYVRIGQYDIRGNSYNELFGNVRDHARNNDVEVGNLDRFIQESIVKRWPEGKISR